MKIYQAEKLISLYIWTDSLIVVQCYITVCGLIAERNRYKQTSKQINTCNSSLNNALWLMKSFHIDYLSGDSILIL